MLLSLDVMNVDLRSPPTAATRSMSNGEKRKAARHSKAEARPQIETEPALPSAKKFRPRGFPLRPARRAHSAEACSREKRRSEV